MRRVGHDRGRRGARCSFGGGPGPAAPSTPDLATASDRGVSNSDNITSVNAPFFRGTATAGTQVRLYVDNQAVATVAVSGGNWQAQASMSDGVHVVSARALDANGTEGPPSAELTVTIDSLPPNPPSVPLILPAGGLTAIAFAANEFIAMITAVKSHGIMKSTRRMLRSTGLTRGEFRSSAKASPISRWKITLITVK